jgi:hypothetical protein
MPDALTARFDTDGGFISLFAAFDIKNLDAFFGQSPKSP